MVSKLKIIADNLIELNKNNPSLLKKYTLISKLLEDKNCFIKMDVNSAYAILRDLKISESHLKEVYIQLLEIR